VQVYHIPYIYLQCCLQCTVGHRLEISACTVLGYCMYFRCRSRIFVFTTLDYNVVYESAYMFLHCGCPLHVLYLLCYLQCSIGCGSCLRLFTYCLQCTIECRSSLRVFTTLFTMYCRVRFLTTGI
jgi:hypothetical protein